MDVSRTFGNAVEDKQVAMAPTVATPVIAACKLGDTKDI